VHRMDAGKGGIISLLSADEMAWTPKLLSVEHLTANLAAVLCFNLYL